MDDLIAFLHARLNEDEQVAKAAIQGPWHTCDHDEDCDAYGVIFGTSPTRSDRRVQVANLEIAWQKTENSAHITRHDPARVLREVEAKRRLLEQFRLRGDSVRRTVQPSTGGVWDDLLRMLVLPYANHPDCREEWKP